jgi:hypothetical protein
MMLVSRGASSVEELMSTKEFRLLVFASAGAVAVAVKRRAEYLSHILGDRLQ